MAISGVTTASSVAAGGNSSFGSSPAAKYIIIAIAAIVLIVLIWLCLLHVQKRRFAGKGIFGRARKCEECNRPLGDDKRYTDGTSRCMPSRIWYHRGCGPESVELQTA
ncbi:hypothetical protein I302_108017 [Kwoniella bestiolae CBS 10118]|uniref:Uncharacterized protein n=1 Tax=Kwoniella bestiolae CBS 10118 TaxID=1296100 RepID=A0A1B9FWW8_9TREE|nr:hypothetical protein I302_07617 [Kwoniella bestiolae CBS 10118]OCF23263.1 hypothetical protein I302_07617 [Kwoniella bestiolae CBS 10118]